MTDVSIPLATASALAEQNSELTGNDIRATGYAEGAASVTGEDSNAYGSAQSNVAIRFLLEQPSRSST